MCVSRNSYEYTLTRDTHPTRDRRDTPGREHTEATRAHRPRPDAHATVRKGRGPQATRKRTSRRAAAAEAHAQRRPLMRGAPAPYMGNTYSTYSTWAPQEPYSIFHMERSEATRVNMQ